MNSTVSNFILLNSFNSLLFFIIENKGEKGIIWIY